MDIGALLLGFAVASGALSPGQEVSAAAPVEVRALPAAEVENLLAGKGMGLAKAAELNGYPGPVHVLDLARQLGLTDDQETQTRRIHARMDANAKALGAQLVAAEAALDLAFRSRSITTASLSGLMAKITDLQARLRETHLAAHIEQSAVLSSEQVARYNLLRGHHEGGGSRTPNGHDAHPE